MNFLKSKNFKFVDNPFKGLGYYKIIVIIIKHIKSIKDFSFKKSVLIDHMITYYPSNSKNKFKNFFSIRNILILQFVLTAGEFEFK